MKLQPILLVTFAAALTLACRSVCCENDPVDEAATPDTAAQAPEVESEAPAVAADEVTDRPRRRDERIFQDANGNGVEDSEDIVTGTSEDADANGIPDEAEDF